MPEKEYIIIKGAREHNLKNINLVIPRNKLVVITGISGSGKSSLAFDTLYAEGQRRYVESLSAYARQFLGQMEKPDVDYIEGLSPTIAIQQRTAGHNPRSTVGTTTEIYDYLRVLFARIGKAYCPNCSKLIMKQSIDQIVDKIISYPQNEKIIILSPLVRGRKGEYKSLLESIKRQGFVRVRIDNINYDLDEKIEIDKNKKHTIEVVVDRISVSKEARSRIADSVETALKLSKGVVVVLRNGKEEIYSELFACVDCGISFPEISPRMFSFNSPYGACHECHGLGVKMEVDVDLVVPDPHLSIRQGAIHPWSSPYATWYHEQLEYVAARYGIDLDKPFYQLKQEHKNIILYGAEGYEGVIPNLERRYKETESEYVRTEIIGSYMKEKVCSSCNGTRLQPLSLSIKIDGKNIIEVTKLSIKECIKFFDNLNLTKKEEKIAHQLIKEIKSRLKFLENVGLSYLTLDRTTGSLSAGELQRIHLATQIGSSLCGVLYILDEPSIGLHQRDNARLLATLKLLRDIGNSVIVVEHDENTIRNADYIIDLGPGAGVHGGNVVATGTLEDIMNSKESLTGAYLRKELTISVPKKRRTSENYIEITGITTNNLKNINVKIYTGIFICITGVSGSGKSSLLEETIYPAIKAELYSTEKVSTIKSISAYKNNKKVSLQELIDKVINIDQSPIGRTPRSNVATYTEVFKYIRDIFASTQEARMRGYKPGRFSFNVKGGRCESCCGDGVIKVEMHFLPPVYVTCEVCQGKRFNKESLEVKYKGKNIADVLDMIVEEALEFFKNIPQIQRILQVLYDTGLGYIKLGQIAPTLSGGEAQRIKLAYELAKKSTGKTLYILDEPTTGLHFADVDKLLNVLFRLVDAGNTVIVIEHNLDVIKSADYIIDLGPEGGEEGGYIVAEGTPEEVARNTKSYTGQFLKKIL
jgi:excinuclease ABC subunit A